MPTDATKANRIVLLNGVSAVGTGLYCEVAGGQYILSAEGTLGGTTLSLMKKGPNDTAVAVSGVSITVAGADVSLDIAAGTEIAGVSTGGSPSGVYLTLTKVP